MVGDVAVIDRVRGLHARGDPEAREAVQVCVGHELRVLDRADRARPRECVQGVRVGDIADRMHRGLQAPGRCDGHEFQQFLGRDGHHAVVAVGAGVRVRAGRGPCAERPVCDDLEGPDAHQIGCRAANGIAGT